MTKQIKAYLSFLEEYFSTEKPEKELIIMRGKLLQRISFYQHERLIHLIVTMSVAVFFLLALIMFLTFHSIGLLMLTVLLLVLMASYIKHYYFLENSVQKMYLYYYKIENL